MPTKPHWVDTTMLIEERIANLIGQGGIAMLAQNPHIAILAKAL